MEKSSGDRENGWEREDVPVERERSFSLKCSGGMVKNPAEKRGLVRFGTEMWLFPFFPSERGGRPDLEKG